MRHSSVDLNDSPCLGVHCVLSSAPCIGVILMTRCWVKMKHLRENGVTWRNPFFVLSRLPCWHLCLNITLSWWGLFKVRSKDSSSACRNWKLFWLWLNRGLDLDKDLLLALCARIAFTAYPRMILLHFLLSFMAMCEGVFLPPNSWGKNSCLWPPQCV